MKVGIFFGGQSREREVSFAGGRTVYDNLDKGLFTPVPIFVDSRGNFIHLDWQYLYKGTIRDFYPPVSHLPETKYGFQIYAESLGELSEEEVQALAGAVGSQVQPSDFASLFDFAFLALHGSFGEDGSLQGLLEWYGIPYSGSGLLPSAIGIDKALQRMLFGRLGFDAPLSKVISRAEWAQSSPQSLFEELTWKLGNPLVVKAAHQGSSIGISILRDATVAEFTQAVNRAFFMDVLPRDEWRGLTDEQKRRYIIGLTDIRQGIGLPVEATAGKEAICIYHPDHLYDFLEENLSKGAAPAVRLEALEGEESVLFESFLSGREFSCIVIEGEDGEVISLPPTEIVKSTELFDYRAKYLPGISRKITPIGLPSELIRDVQDACCSLFMSGHFEVYARIDGFITEEGRIYLNDPNTTSGMMPSSFFFHQAAEIGLNPSQFLTYQIRTSIEARIRSNKHSRAHTKLLAQLDESLQRQQVAEGQKIPVAVLLGGYSSERHISVESGRNIYEKLASSGKYAPIPVFLTGTADSHELYILPTNLLLKDNADDIKHKIADALSNPTHEVVAEVIAQAASITKRYAQDAVFKPEPLTYEELASRVDVAFIALHGRPGEDGAVQQQLDRVGIAYNGSGVQSSQLTIDKYATNEKLRAAGISVAKHALLTQKAWNEDAEAALEAVAKEFGFPLIAKPSDDGCSSAVKKIANIEELRAFALLMFREGEDLLLPQAKVLNLSPKEEFPRKKHILIEELISPNGADHFLEITGGLLTKHGKDGKLSYEVFEPSEALASGEILSLEEKFLAGEGQNITPARFSTHAATQQEISEQVRETLAKAAQTLGIEGYTRIDAFVRIFGNKAETVIIEANSLPGMTPATCIFHQSAINGYTPFDFIDHILEYGLERRKQITAKA